MSCSPKTIRLDRELESNVRAYCRKNDVSLNRLVNIAVEKFISEPHVIEMSPLSPKELADSRENDGRDKKRDRNS